MDPITIIVSSLALGIAAGIKPTAEQAIKDAYQGLKELLQKRYEISLENWEKKPESNAQKAAISEALAENKVGEDAEVVEKAGILAETVEKSSPEIAQTIGVNLIGVKAGIATFRNIRASHDSIGVKAEGGTFDRLEFGDVETDNNPKND